MSHRVPLLMQRLFRAFWPLAAWMVLVFVMSTDVGSASHTGIVLVRILRWLDPSITLAGIESAHFLVRKAAHLTEYAVLAILILRALRVAKPMPLSRWSWAAAAMSFFGSAAYAASDEIHQLFVPTRGPSATDVLIDSTGAAIGIAVAFAWYWFRRSRGRPALGASPVAAIGE